MTILEQLCEWSEPEETSPRLREKIKKVGGSVDQVASAFSPVFMEELVAAEMEVQCVMTEEAFARGFRMGVALVIAGIQP